MRDRLATSSQKFGNQRKRPYGRTTCGVGEKFEKCVARLYFLLTRIGIYRFVWVSDRCFLGWREGGRGEKSVVIISLRLVLVEWFLAGYFCCYFLRMSTSKLIFRSFRWVQMLCIRMDLDWLNGQVSKMRKIYKVANQWGFY